MILASYCVKYHETTKPCSVYTCWPRYFLYCLFENANELVALPKQLQLVQLAVTLRFCAQQAEKFFKNMNNKVKIRFRSWKFNDFVSD